MDEDADLATLTDSARHLVTLADRLLHVKWSRETLLLLATACQNLGDLIQGHIRYKRITELMAALETSLQPVVKGNPLPSGEARQRFIEQLRALCESLSAPPSPEKTTHPPVNGSVLLLGADDTRLSPLLRNAGMQVRTVRTLAEVRTTLIATAVDILIVDLDTPEGSLLASHNMMVDERDRLDRLTTVVFLSERGDLAARLEAVSAGGTAYLKKPVHRNTLLTTLNNHLRSKNLAGYRLLLIEDSAHEAQKLLARLERTALTVHRVDQPLEVVPALYQFLPDVILLDSDLSQVNGFDLARAIHQHPDFRSVPLLLIAAQVDIKKQMAAFAAGAGYILSKSHIGEHLVPVLGYLLQRKQEIVEQSASLKTQDGVSGLHHRRHFMQALESALRDATPVTLLLITLDNLRAIEARALLAADQLVEQVALRLCKLLDAEYPFDYQAARFNDASFIVQIPFLEAEKLMELAHNIRSMLEGERYNVMGEAVELRVSIGMNRTTTEPLEATLLLQQLQQAASAAWAGRDHISLYDPDVERVQQTLQQQKFLDEIREAVQNQRMSLVFQPVVSLRGDQTERYEVLLRIRNQDGLELLPETVFTVTQKHKLGMALDRWVITHALRLLRSRHTLNQETILFVNISPAILHDKEFIDWLRKTLEKTHLPAHELVFEMAEMTARQHLPLLRKFTEEIKQLGCGFSLDRFGHNDQSLTLLKSLPVDYVKLDSQLTQDIAHNDHKKQQLQEFIEQLKTTQVTAVAGGVENLPALCTLSSCGVGYVQGFLLQRPREDMAYDFATSAL